MSDRHCLALRQGTCDWELTQADYARESRGINRAKDLMGLCHFISVRQSGSRRARHGPVGPDVAPCWYPRAGRFGWPNRLRRPFAAEAGAPNLLHPTSEFSPHDCDAHNASATSAANLFLILYSFSFHTHCRCLFSMSQRPSLPPFSLLPRVSFNLSQLVGENLCK